MPRVCRRIVRMCALAVAVTAATVSRVLAQSRQDEFVPVDQLPPTEQMPAAPLVIGAYVFVLVALFAYVASLVRRMHAVQQDVARLEGQLAARGRNPESR